MSFIQRIVSGYKPNLQEFVQNFGHIFELLQQLRLTSQDSEWHREGDVFIHTQMVLENIYTIIDMEANLLDGEQKLSLILAAIFHDIGKPLTTRESNETKRIIAPHHEFRGCSYIAHKMYRLDLPYHMVQHVLNLVRYHHMPKLLVIRDSRKSDYFHLGRLVNVEMLYYLAKADMLGRQCSNQQEQLNLIDLFKMFCEEYGIWKRANPYDEWLEFFKRELSHYPADTQDYVYRNGINDFEAERIFTPHEAIARHYSYLDAFPRLTIMCGPSGSGKSSWIQEHLSDYEVISLDQLREESGKSRSDQSVNDKVLQKAKQLLKMHLAQRKRVVWDATNLRKDFRSILNDLGMDYRAFTTLLVFHQKVGEILSGNKHRQASVASDIIRDQINHMEWVALDEAHKVVFINRTAILQEC